MDQLEHDVGGGHVGLAPAHQRVVFLVVDLTPRGRAIDRSRPDGASLAWIGLTRE
jgi:hypothetical protein